MGVQRDRDRVTILAIFAHPDDESLACGALLSAAAEQGADVSLLCLTRGEAGPGGDPRRLGEVRAAELREAARVLGARDVTILEHADGMLPFIDSALLVRDIAHALQDVQPDVVITFDLDGLYWHPDHVAVHERVTAAVAALGDTAPALWYVSMPQGSVRALVNAAAPRMPGAPLLGIEDPDAFGVLAPAPSVVFTDEGAAARKLAALRCHRTQTEGTALDLVDERVAATLLATEHYRRAEVGARGETLVARLGLSVAAARS
jgi:N-acetyl-1-D-myo-inositol-2-amino-2-deoxy-alpha-D-glucopyranoside deacetylase